MITSLSRKGKHLYSYLRAGELVSTLHFIVRMVFSIDRRFIIAMVIAGDMIEFANDPNTSPEESTGVENYIHLRPHANTGINIRMA